MTATAIPRADAPGSGRRVVMYVRNACTNDVRVLREAATLRDDGWTVTVMALLPSGADLPASETRDGIRIVRSPSPGDWRRRWRDMRYYPWRAIRTVPSEVGRARADDQDGGTEAASIVLTAIAALPYATVQGIRYVVSRRARPTPHAEEDGVDRLAWWRLSVLGWAAAAAAGAPVADVHHGHDLTGLPAALRASRRQGGAAPVIYDSHELFIEAGDTARQSPWVRRVLASLERRWIAQVAGIVTVNESIAGELHRRYGGPDPVIVRNAPPKTSLPEPRPDHLRIAAGIPAGAKVVLYHGGFQRDRGLEVLAEAMLEPSMAAAHLVYMGFGPLQASLEATAAEPRFGGRIHVLPAVDPGVLLDWVASADVSAMPNQPRTLNERYSTPNKLFESIAVGTPVVSSDFPERRRIVIDDPDGPLGAVCDPTRATELARALAGVLDLDPAAADDLRRRCHRAATLRWNWELESARLLELYRGLPAPQTSSGSQDAR